MQLHSQNSVKVNYDMFFDWNLPFKHPASTAFGFAYDPLIPLYGKFTKRVLFWELGLKRHDWLKEFIKVYGADNILLQF